MDFRKFTAFSPTFLPISDIFPIFVGPKSNTKLTFNTMIPTQQGIEFEKSFQQVPFILMIVVTCLMTVKKAGLICN